MSNITTIPIHPRPSGRSVAQKEPGSPPKSLHPSFLQRLMERSPVKSPQQGTPEKKSPSYQRLSGAWPDEMGHFSLDDAGTGSQPASQPGSPKTGAIFIADPPSQSGSPTGATFIADPPSQPGSQPGSPQSGSPSRSPTGGLVFIADSPQKGRSPVLTTAKATATLFKKLSPFKRSPIKPPLPSSPTAHHSPLPPPHPLPSPKPRRLFGFHAPATNEGSSALFPKTRVLSDQSEIHVRKSVEIEQAPEEVTVLDLSNRNLRDNDLPDFSRYPNLKKINLSGNWLTYVPYSLFKIKGIKINLRNNQLSASHVEKIEKDLELCRKDGRGLGPSKIRMSKQQYYGEEDNEQHASYAEELFGIRSKVNVPGRQPKNRSSSMFSDREQSSITLAAEKEKALQLKKMGREDSGIKTDYYEALEQAEAFYAIPKPKKEAGPLSGAERQAFLANPENKAFADFVKSVQMNEGRFPDVDYALRDYTSAAKIIQTFAT